HPRPVLRDHAEPDRRLRHEDVGLDHPDLGRAHRPGGSRLARGTELGTLDGDRPDQHQLPHAARLRRIPGIPALGADGADPEPRRALRADGALDRYARAGVRKYALTAGEVPGPGPRE